jgi:hypothetical protein
MSSRLLSLVEAAVRFQHLIPHLVKMNFYRKYSQNLYIYFLEKHRIILYYHVQ